MGYSPWGEEELDTIEQLTPAEDKHCEADTQAGLSGSPGHKSLSVSLFLITGNRLHSASRTFAEFQGQVETATNQ